MRLAGRDPGSSRNGARIQQAGGHIALPCTQPAGGPNADRYHEWRVGWRSLFPCGDFAPVESIEIAGRQSEISASARLGILYI